MVESFRIPLAVVLISLIITTCSLDVGSNQLENSNGFGANITEEKTCDCGYYPIVPRIFMGKQLQRHEFPWMAYIVIHNWFGVSYCGGSLLDEQHVLTAGHCIGQSPPPLKVDVFLGHFNRKMMEKGLKGIHVEVERWVTPPNYDFDDNLNRDIAILVLKTKIRFTSDVTPICILRNAIEFRKFILAGWGKLGPQEKGADNLMKVELDFIDSKTCEILSANHHYRETLRQIPAARNKNLRIISRPFYETHLCAINVKSGGDACKGDSGGPLMYAGNYRWYVVGTVSGGAPCGSAKQFPGWYTRVDYYTSWIESVAKNAQICSLN